MTDNAAALQAELLRLEGELEKKRLEQQIQALESQLVQQGAQQAAAAEEEEEYCDDEEEYEEIVEEYEEEDTDNDKEIASKEEVIESPEHVKKGRVSRNSKQPVAASGSAPAPRTTASPPPKVRVSSNNAFTKALAEKKAAAEQAEQEKASRALAAAAKANASASSGAAGCGGDNGDDGGPLPPLPPFTPRVIPGDVPASPAGQETRMELLIGPKLYSQGKLISRSTVAGCTGMDLILLYFGAGWKKDCKVFFPLLLDFYTITTATSIDGNDNIKLECIYVPQDRNLNEFKSFFAKTPFLSMATGTAALKNEMAKSLYITDVPTVIVLDASTGHVISTQGVAEIQNLKRRDVLQCQALVRKWKETTPVPFCDAEKAGIVQRDGNLQRGILYWQE